MIALLLACADPAPEALAEPTGTDTGADTAAAADAPLALTPAQNYALSLDLAVQTVQIAAWADAEVNWSGVTQDLNGHAVTVDDVDYVWLLLFRDLSVADVAAAAATDTLWTPDAAEAYRYQNQGSAKAHLSSFQTAWGPFDAAAQLGPDRGTWMLRLQRADGTDVSWLALDPVEGQPAAGITVDDTSATLTVTADLGAATPLVVDEGTAPEVDWAGLDRGATGAALDPLDIQALVLAHYADADASTVAAGIVDWRDTADATWSMDVYGTRTASLADGTGDTGAFPGFDGSGLWLLALDCAACQLHAPLFLTPVDIAPSGE